MTTQRDETNMEFDDQSDMDVSDIDDDDDDGDCESLDFGSDFDFDIESDYEGGEYFPNVGGTPTLKRSTNMPTATPIASKRPTLTRSPTSEPSTSSGRGHPNWDGDNERGKDEPGPSYLRRSPRIRNVTSTPGRSSPQARKRLYPQNTDATAENEPVIPSPVTLSPPRRRSRLSRSTTNVSESDHENGDDAGDENHDGAGDENHHGADAGDDADDDDDSGGDGRAPANIDLSDSESSDHDDQRGQRNVRGRQAQRGRRAGQRGARRRDRPPMRWTKVTRHNPVVYPFNEQPGLTQQMKDQLPDNPTPKDYYELYIPDNFVDHIVDQTNLYGNQIKQQKIANGTLKQKSLLRKWHGTDRAEMKKFLSILFLMGLDKKGTYNEYWKRDPLLYTPSFSKIMSRDRFTLMKRCLHFNDNEQAPDPNDPDRDRLYKIRPLIDHINRICKLVYVPPREVSVDESLILFKGKLFFKQTIRTKRARVGVKMYPLCTFDGITMSLRIYSAQAIPFEDVQSDYEFSKTEQIVLNLMQPYLDKGYHVYTDNFYTSPQLAKYLHERHTHICGTIRPNRKDFPTQQMSQEDLNLGSSVHYVSQDKSLLAVKYREAQNRASGQPKIVHALSTMHTCRGVDTGKVARTTNLPIVKPHSVYEYNKYMGGVDLTDQQLGAGVQSICPMRKTLKWSSKVAIRLLLQMMLNAHKVYKENEGPIPKSNNLRWFSAEVARAWSGFEAIPETMVGIDRDRLDQGLHVPGETSREGNKARSPQIRCKVCSKRGHRSVGIIQCQTCPEKPGLCVRACQQDGCTPFSEQKNCWEVWHTQRDYSVTR